MSAPASTLDRTIQRTSTAPTPDFSTPEANSRWQGCVSVIVPVYNEAAHVDELLRAIHASPVKKEIIIVDDGSTDGTRDILKALPPSDDVTVVFHERNYGKGAAIRPLTRGGRAPLGFGRGRTRARSFVQSWRAQSRFQYPLCLDDSIR